jgi:phage-related minor tail protein
MMFPMSGGRVGTAFEKNAEAIMPLARDSSGNLGVKVADSAAAGGDTVVNLTVEVYQGKGDGVKTEQGQNDKGDVLKIFIGEVAADVQRGGQVGKAITQTYGISRKARSYS